MLLACKSGSFKIIELLIERIDIKVSFIYNTASPDLQPLHMLMKNKAENAPLVARILEKIRQVSVFDLNEQLLRMDHNRQSILQISIENNHLKTTELLLREYYVTEELREDKNGNLPVHFAARVSGSEVLAVLIANSAFSLKTNGNYENALHIAAANNRFKFIAEFLAHEQSLVDQKDPEFLKGLH